MKLNINEKKLKKVFKNLFLSFVIIFLIIFSNELFSQENSNIVNNETLNSYVDIIESTPTKLDFKKKRVVLENINKLKDKDKKKKILKELMKERDEFTKQKAVIELSKTKDSDVLDELIRNIESDDIPLAISSLEGLRNYQKNKKAEDAVIKALKNREKNIRWQAVVMCGEMKINGCVDGLGNIIKNKNEDSYIIRSVIDSLYKIRTQKAINLLNSFATTETRQEIKTMCRNVISLINKERKVKK